MAVEPKTKVQTILAEEQHRLIYDNLELGEIVQDTGDQSLAVVINKRDGVWITFLKLAGASYHFYEIADLSFIIKLLPFDRPNGFTIDELVKEFKIRLEWAHTWHTWRIDNLTYIEILARLKEYETGLS